MKSIQPSSSLARVGEKTARFLRFAEIEGPFKDNMKNSRDLMYAMSEARREGFLKNQNPMLRLKAELLAARFVKLAQEEIVEDVTFMPEGALIFIDLFLTGTDDQGRREFADALMHAAVDARDFMLPTSVFKHFALACRLQYTPAQQRTLLDWAKLEDGRNAASEASRHQVVETKPYSNREALEKVLVRTQEKSWR